MIHSANDSIWTEANIKGLTKDEIAQRQLAWRRRGEQPIVPTPPPSPASTSIDELLDREYARHGRRFGDIALSRPEWDNRVREHVFTQTRPSGAYVARSPYAMVGQDAVKGIRTALGPGDDINKANLLKTHFEGLGRP